VACRSVPVHGSTRIGNYPRRATEIIKLFITKYAVAPDRLSASGYGEYHRVASKETEEGRATNRRVDLVILSSNAEPVVPPRPVVVPEVAPSATAPE
jgi:chemotaxis protein MotB